MALVVLDYELVMARKSRKQVYPKDETDTLRDTVKKLKSRVRNLQKTIRELKSENSTLLDAWSKTEAFLQEVTEGEPLEEVIRYNKLPKKLLRKKEEKVVKELEKEEDREKARKKWAQWRKDNL